MNTNITDLMSQTDVGRLINGTFFLNASPNDKEFGIPVSIAYHPHLKIERVQINAGDQVYTTSIEYWKDNGVIKGTGYKTKVFLRKGVFADVTG